MIPIFPPNLTNLPCIYHFSSTVPGYDKIDITFLGTGSSIPTLERNVQSLILRLDSDVWLFDAGEGTQIQLLKLKHTETIRKTNFQKIFISHLHGDHIYGLPGILCYLAANNIQKRSSTNDHVDKLPIDIYGPVGIADFVVTALSHQTLAAIDLTINEIDVNKSVKQTNQTFNGKKRHKRNLVRINSDNTIHLFDTPKAVVSAALIKHSVPCFGFVVEEKQPRPVLNVKKLKAHYNLNPGPFCKNLKDGEDVFHETAGLISARSVLDKPRPGRKLVLLSDTNDASNIYQLGRNADVLVHECTIPEDVGVTEAKKRGHSTPSMAAQTAVSTNCKHLILTHWSPKFTLDSSKGYQSSEQAKKIVQSIYSGKITEAVDLLTVVIPKSVPEI